jgi:NAD-dependent deacetylase
MSDLESQAELLAEGLQKARGKYLVVITGAGISLASGIPTFRGTDQDAVWKKDVTELGTYRFFRQNPVESWLWSHRIFGATRDAKPNPAHTALAEIEQQHTAAGGRFLLITQNIDTLHEQAGSQALVKVHGSADRYRCASPLGCVHGAPSGSIAAAEVDFGPFFAAPKLENLPRCQVCGDLLRRHVLWFDEYYQEHDDYQWQRVQDAAQLMDALVFVGTSFSVGVTEMFLQAALFSRVPAFSVDPSGFRPHLRLETLKAKAEELLPAVSSRLG